MSAAFFQKYSTETTAMRERAQRLTDVIAPVFVSEQRHQELMAQGLAVEVRPEDYAIVRLSFRGQLDPRREGPAPERPIAVITFLT